MRNQIRRAIEAIAGQDHEEITKAEDDPVKAGSSINTDRAKLLMVVNGFKKRLEDIPRYTVRPTLKDLASPSPSQTLYDYIRDKFKGSRDGIFHFDSDEDSEADELFLNAEQIGSIENCEQEETNKYEADVTFHYSNEDPLSPGTLLLNECAIADPRPTAFFDSYQSPRSLLPSHFFRWLATCTPTRSEMSRRGPRSHGVLRSTGIALFQPSSSL